MAEAKFSIVKLNNENYFVWKYKMELLLIKEGLWDTIIKEKPNPVPDIWIKKDNEARATIGLSVEDNQLLHLRKAKSAKEAWDNLKDYHEKATLSNKVTLMRKICSLRLEENDNMERHIANMTEYFEKLIALGEKAVSEKWIVAMLLSSLPKSYDTLITALETRTEDNLTLNLVQSKLIDEYKRINQGISSENALVTEDKNTECFFCRKLGHLKKNCRKYIIWKKKRENVHVKQVAEVETEGSFCFNVTNLKDDGWVIDSGASCHISNNKDSFIMCSPTSRKVTVANGIEEVAEGIGAVKIIVVNNKNKEVAVLLEEVLFIPTMERNLLSVKQLAKKGFNVVFRSNDCQIIKNGTEIAVAEQCNGLYKLKQRNEVYEVVECGEKCLHYWHRVLGHRDAETIKLMNRQNLVKGMELHNCGIKKTCEVCLEGKFSRLPFPKKSTKSSTALLDLIHSDICGPMQTETPSGNRYFLTFIDDFSRYTKVYLLKHKGEVFTKFKEFVEFLKTQFGKKPKVLRSDQGGEYRCHQMQQYFRQEGIKFQYTAPYSPQQNGVSERKNRSLMEMARCMLIDANLPNWLWGEAVVTANFMQNRLPTKFVVKTPYEIWFNKTPNLSNLHVFGSKVYVFIPQQQRRKLDRKSHQLIFVGYDEHIKGFRLVDCTSRKITISRDVKFLDPVTMCQETTEEKMEKNIVKVNSDATSLFEETNNQENLQNENEVESNIQEIESHSQIKVSEDKSTENEERKSERKTKGIPPKRYGIDEEVNNISAKRTVENTIEVKTYQEAVSSKDKEEWKKAMEEEMESLKQHGTWISWSCRKQSCVALSSTESEFIALSEACKEAIWLENILAGFKEKIPKPIEIFEDNQSCLKMIISEKFSNRSKHIDTKYHFVKDYIAQSIVKCTYCPTEDMLADLLTKPLPEKRVALLRTRCGLIYHE